MPTHGDVDIARYGPLHARFTAGPSRFQAAQTEWIHFRADASLMGTVYATLLFIAVILGLALAGLIAIYQRHKPLFMASLLVLLGVPLAAYVIVSHASKLKDVPRGLGVSTILYDGGANWSLDDAGVRVYALPGQAIRNVIAGGETYLSSLPPNKNPWLESWRGDYSRYGGWRRTPIVPSQRWQLDAHTSSLSVSGYFRQREWVMHRRHEEVSRQIEAAINQPGSYYAFGDGGTLIIQPVAGKAFYIYTPFED